MSLGIGTWMMLSTGVGFASTARSLATGSAIEGRLTPGQQATFRLVADRIPRLISVESRGIDLLLKVHGPTGFSATVDGPGGNRGHDSVLVPPFADDPFAVRLTATGLGEAPSGYRLTVEGLDPDDDVRLAAERAIMDAGSAHAAAADAEITVDHLRAALGDLEGHDLPRRVAQVTAALAAALDTAGKATQAVAVWQDAAALWRDLGDQTGEAQARFGLAGAHLRRSAVDEAAASLHQAATLWRADGDLLGALHTRAAECLVDHRRGAFASARACYEGVGGQAAGLGARGLEALVTSSLGGVLQALGEPSRALDSHRRAVILRQATEDPRGEAQARNNLGALYRSLGEGAKAAAEYRAALAIFEAEGDERWQARTLNNLAFADLVRGDIERAHLLFEASLVLRRQVGDRNGEAVTLSNLGRALLLAGDTEAALEAFRASFEIRQELGNRRGEAAALQMIGTALTFRGEHAAALAVLKRAEAAYHALGDRPREAAVLMRRGQALLGLGRLDAAHVALTEALHRFVSLADPDGQVSILTALAETARARHADLDAEGFVNRARALIERQRLRFGDPLRRATYLAAQGRIFEFEVELLMSRHAREPNAGHDRAAFAAAEAARARALVDRVAIGTLEQGLDETRRGRLTNAQRQLDAKATRAAGLRVRGADSDSIVAANADVHRALGSIEALWMEIRDLEPRFSELARPAPVQSEAVMRSLDDETLVLAYRLGGDRSYLWALSKRRMTTYELPGRQVIEDLARSVHRELTAIDLRTRTSDSTARRRLTDILLAPVAERLTARRLMIVADGALHYVPFAALPHPSATATPLAARHEILRLPATSLLQPGPRTIGPRSPRLASRERIAVVADPVHAASDPRLPTRVTESRTPAATGAATRIPAAVDSLPRLAHARREATAIADLAPARVDRFHGFAAQRSLLTGGTLDHHMILHFATHGWIDGSNPDLSAIVLSRFDEQGDSRPGLVRLHDIFGLDLDAELVVLSGCRTALGREVRGEGLLGLARGFLFAGAGSVIASLWPVDDEAAALFMEVFYRALLIGGRSPAAALNAAQNAIRAEHRFRDPAYWAPFVLIGGASSTRPIGNLGGRSDT